MDNQRLTITIPPEAREAINARLGELYGAAAENTFDVPLLDDQGVILGYVCSWDIGATGYSLEDFSIVKSTVEKLGQDAFEAKEPEIGKEGLKLTAEETTKLVAYVSIVEGEVEASEKEAWIEEQKIALKTKEPLPEKEVVIDIKPVEEPIEKPVEKPVKGK